MNADLINIDYIIHYQKLSDKFNHKHFEIVFATLHETLVEKHRSFWQIIFSSPNTSVSYSLIHKKYIKQGVAWYCAKNLTRASVAEEVLLNRVLEKLEGCRSVDQNIKKYIYQLDLKLTRDECKKLIDKYLMASGKKKIAPVTVKL